MQLLTLAILLPTLGLFSLSLLGGQFAQRHVVQVRRWGVNLAACQLGSAVLAAALWWSWGRGRHDLVLFPAGLIPGLGSINLLLDGATVLMFALISFIGWVICRYSVRYLDGDPNQARFFQSLCFTLGCVAGLVWSSSLLTYAVAWTGVSLGLHPLLVHYGDRVGAQRAANLKLTFSRLGSLLMLIAVVMLHHCYGTTNFSQLASVATASGSSSQQPLAAVCWLLVCAALLKTAQFPFHAWLPQTLETPTPVSALMHAGVVNAGGFLLLRCSQWFVVDNAPLILLTTVGGMTAVFGAVVMSTQPTVKRQLAYSTIAQMGFMLLQCGLGLFSAAMLHILAHSLYKAYAFLYSGNVLKERVSTQACTASQATAGLAASAEMAWGIPLAVATLLSGSLMLGWLFGQKAGALPLFGLWLLAMAYLLATAWTKRCKTTFVRALWVVGLLANVYPLSLWGIGKVLSDDYQLALQPAWLSTVVVLLGLCLLVAWQAMRFDAGSSAWRKALYVHASNGFYLESCWRRAVTRQSLPVA